MAPESGTVLAVAAAFLLLGIALSPLAWVAILNRRSRSERLHDRRFAELEARSRALDERMAGCESSLLALQSGSQRRRMQATHPRPIRATATRGWFRPDDGETAPDAIPHEPALIAVPNLAAAPGDREAMRSGLTQRYAAIWTLADTGAAPDVIARATGQPIGQIELILGLRRQIHGTRTTISHASHE
jgi:hypothetical protein